MQPKFLKKFTLPVQTLAFSINNETELTLTSKKNAASLLQHFSIERNIYFQFISSILNSVLLF